MKPRRSNQKSHALTRVEVLVIFTVTSVLLCVALAWAIRAGRKAASICCICNLHQIGLSIKTWSGDHFGGYPTQLSVTNGGVMELVRDGENVWPVFQVMSNELSTPRALLCPRDAGRNYATNFGTGFSDSNISYFVSLDATETEPNMLLIGDDNLTVDGLRARPGILNLWTNTAIAWTKERHAGIGNIGLSDGSAQQIVGITNGFAKYSGSDDAGLISPFLVGLTTNRLAIP